MAVSGARIRKRVSRLGNEFPVVTRRPQGELQNAECAVVPHFAVPFAKSKFSKIFPARTHDKFPDPSLGIRMPVGILRRKTFVVMVVAVHNKFGVEVV